MSFFRDLRTQVRRRPDDAPVEHAVDVPAPEINRRTGMVDNAIYVKGARTANPASLDETYELLHERKAMAWIGLYRPDDADIQSVATEFGLHALAALVGTAFALAVRRPAATQRRARS